MVDPCFDMRGTILRLRRISIGFAILAVGAVSAPFLGNSEDPADIQVEALLRLKDSNLDERPAIRQALSRVLEKVKGRAPFVELVREFHLKDQNSALIDFAIAHPDDSAAVDAIKTALNLGGMNLIKEALAKTNQTLALIDLLGKSSANAAGELLHPWVTNSSTTPIAVKRAAVRALVRSKEGAEILLRSAEGDQLGSDLKWVVSTELASVRWPEIRKAGQIILPPPTTKGQNELPPVGELIQRIGDAGRGASIFRRSDINCIGCHEVRGEGVDFGPKLSEIGAKLGKDALYEAILDPNSGISFGFEAWTISLKNGDELFGLIASETEDELALKIQGGTILRLKKAELLKREKQSQSMMPAGLQANLSTDEFVDLVEYLVSLKKL